MLLNLTPDHLDRHASFDDYAGAKMRLFENQLEGDAAVLNADDPEVTRRMPSRPHIYWFSRQKRVAAGAFLHDGQIVFRTEGARWRSRGGRKSRCAASTTSKMCWLPALRHSSREPIRGHRERREDVSGCRAPVGVCRGDRGRGFYNDSKATNVDAALKAIEAFPGPLIVILGGKDKGSPYTPLAEPLRSARATILIGAAAEKIATDLGDSVPIVQAVTLERAVKTALARAKPGDTVLLAPACSSFDQFENYEHRGRRFKELVGRLDASRRGRPRKV